jgi:hypothetical protein
MRYGGALMSIRWEGKVEANLKTLGLKNKRAMVAAANYVAPKLEAHMRNNASWTDRTGAARAGLGAQVVTSTNRVAIVMFHSVSYGVYLETRWGGKYAIIRPTMPMGGQMFAETFKRLAGLQ